MYLSLHLPLCYTVHIFVDMKYDWKISWSVMKAEDRAKIYLETHQTRTAKFEDACPVFKS